MPKSSVNKSLVSAFLLVVFSSSLLATTATDEVRKFRIAAEWEPAIGVMIAWPLVLPEQLIVDLAKEEIVFVALEDMANKNEAMEKFSELGISADKLKFFAGDPETESTTDPSDRAIELPKESANKNLAGEQSNSPGGDATRDETEDLYQKIYIWTRDWGPFAGFDDDGKYSLIDPQFADYPMSKMECDAQLRYFPGGRTEDWNSDEVANLAETMKADAVQVPIYITGGNVMFDGQGTAISTCITLNENRHFGVSQEKYFETAKSYLGIENYYVIPNFESFGIQHIDCFLKLLDEERVLIARPPSGHESFQRYEDLVARIASLKNCYGRPYQIYRIDAGEVTNESMDDPELKAIVSEGFGKDMEAARKGIAAYTNSLILNKRVFVPLYGISTDGAALRTWQAIMPGYQVLGYEFTKRTGSKIPWQSFDALHCRTRAIWDPQMLYMKHMPLQKKTPMLTDGYTIHAKIVDYSRSGLVSDSLQVHWRRKGAAEWKKSELRGTKNVSHFAGLIPATAQGTTIEYYISAADQSGRVESLPRTAPDHFYSFAITGDR